MRTREGCVALLVFVGLFWLPLLAAACAAFAL